MNYQGKLKEFFDYLGLPGDDVEQQELFHRYVITVSAWLYMRLVDSVTEIDPETLQKVLLEIINEVEIMKKILRLPQIEGGVYQSKREFEANLKELIEDIDDPEDDYRMEGKCQRCEPWNQ